MRETSEVHQAPETQHETTHIQTLENSNNKLGTKLGRSIKGIAPRVRLLIVVLLFAALGTYLLLPSHASTLTLEAETLTASANSGGASVVSDTAASAGQALKYYNNGNAYRQITTPASSQVIITAKGDQCSGTPIMTVKIDGTQAMNANVTNTNYVAFTIPVNLTAAPHTIDISFNNDFYSMGVCDRNLTVDRIDFISQTVTSKCSDGVDNDGDSKIDFPADPGCSSSADADETDVAGTTYYVDCNGDNTKDGKSLATAWRDLTKVNAAPLVAGDGILFKKGCVWNVASTWSGSLIINWSGITIGAYGTGELPTIATTGHSGVVIRVNGSNNTIDSIKVQGPSCDPTTLSCGGADYNLYGIEIVGGKQNNTVKNSYITGTSAGIEVRAGAAYNKIGPNNQFINNNMLHMPAGTNDDSGAFGIALQGNNNEIFQNHFEGQQVKSPDYGADGSSVEIYTSCGASPASNNKIHHNTTTNDNAFHENGRDAGSTCTTIPENNVFAYNSYYTSGISNAIFMNNRGNTGATGGFGGTKNTIVYNNTVYTIGSTSSPVICGSCDYSSFVYRNNLIVAQKGLSISGVDPSKVSNNIYLTSISGLLRSATDFQLASTATSAINQGIAAPDVPSFPTDLKGNATPFGSAVDIGAYEYGY